MPPMSRSSVLYSQTLPVRNLVSRYIGMRSFTITASIAQPSADYFALAALRRWEDDGGSPRTPHIVACTCIPAAGMNLPFGLGELMASLILLGGIVEEESKRAARSWLDIFNRSGRWLLKSQGRWASDTREFIGITRGDGTFGKDEEKRY